QGSPGCEYCRISKGDLETTLGFTSAGLFAGCMPWLCHSFLGLQNPEVCKHYVHAPQNITIEFVESQNPKYETVVVSWRPSQYGIAFLRGFQVSLQTLGGTQIACQLFLLQNNMSLSAVHAQRVYYSDPFRDLSLGTQYAVTVMALPVPEIWERFYHSKLFFTRCMNSYTLSLTVCVNISLAFNSITFYKNYNSLLTFLDIVNSTHHTYHLLNLHMEINYTCEVSLKRNQYELYWRKILKKHLKISDFYSSEPFSLDKEGISLAVLFSVGVLLAAFLAVIVAIHLQNKIKKKAAKCHIPSDINDTYYDEYTEHHFIPVSNRTNRPRLLICYSSSDCSAHVNVVLQLATFVQKHMATEVYLDLWDALSVTEDGDLGWYCRKIKESDFVLVICSKGLNQRLYNQREEELDQRTNTSLAIIAMIGEEIFHAKSLSQDLSKYMTAIFEYSKRSDIPTMLNLASHYTLPKDLPLLFSHLHGVALQKPGAYLLIENISENGYSKLPAGAALLLAIQDARILITG
ncbi:interleukin-17 receptor D isoform X1, partial [Silurus meridionalis]